MTLKRSAFKKKPKRGPTVLSAAASALADNLVKGFDVERTDAETSVRTALGKGASIGGMQQALETTIEIHKSKPLDKPVGFFVAESLKVAAGKPTKRVKSKTEAEKAQEAADSWKPVLTKGTHKIYGMVSMADALAPYMERAKKRLAELGPGDEDEPKCPKCADAGFVRRVVELGHPDFGKVFSCTCNAESKEERVVRLLKASGLTAEQMGMRLKGTRLVPGIEPAIKACEQFIKGEISQLTMTGNPGAGKTRLACACLMAYLDKGVAGLYVNVSRFLDELRNTFERETPETLMQVIGPVMTWPVVVLDDLGGEKSSSWTVEKLYEVIDARYCANLKTIACSNRALEELDMRIVSRLGDVGRGTVVNVEAADYRLTG